MSRVFVVQEQPQVNISPALDYGQLVMMLPPGNHSLNPERMIQVFCDCFEKHRFNHDEDYLLLIGDPVAIAAAAMVLDRYLEGGPVNVLKWDRQERRYIPINLDF